MRSLGNQSGLDRCGPDLDNDNNNNGGQWQFAANAAADCIICLCAAPKSRAGCNRLYTLGPIRSALAMRNHNQALHFAVPIHQSTAPVRPVSQRVMMRGAWVITVRKIHFHVSHVNYLRQSFERRTYIASDHGPCTHMHEFLTTSSDRERARENHSEARACGDLISCTFARVHSLCYVRTR